MNEYFDMLKSKFENTYSVAENARKIGFDPSIEVEIKPTSDVASRVEGLVGPRGVAKRIRELLKSMSRIDAAFEIAKEIVLDENGKTKEEKIEQAVRTSLALYTEGVVSAPIEGVSKVKIKKNTDGSEYVAVYFAGPIRGAGGTGQAFPLLIADYCRQLLNIGNYRPSKDEIERYAEEVSLYAMRTRVGQYSASPEETRHIVSHCPVCITGEPTEKYRIGVHKDIPSVESNYVRGGMCLVISEGICLRAPKILRIANSKKLDWQWIEALIKVSKKTGKTQMKPIGKYMKDLVAGRPIFSYPMRNGGFRLRYGRTPLTGIASKAVHPATMEILDRFPVFGTQLKIERPGKACVLTPSLDIEGPIVKLKSGEVKKIRTREEAQEIFDEIDEILYLGDLLISFGDFLHSGHPLVPPGYCEEWWMEEAREKGITSPPKDAKEAFAISKKHALPLYPKYLFFWKSIGMEELEQLIELVSKGEFKNGILKFKNDPEKKRILELIGAEHKVKGDSIVIEGDEAYSLFYTISPSAKKTGETVLKTLTKRSGVEIRDKGGTWIGGSMGRPEKAKPRKMRPPVNVLFPIGLYGGITRDIVKAYKSLSEKGDTKIQAEVQIRACPVCGRTTIETHCPVCKELTIPMRVCPKCGALTKDKICKRCGVPTRPYSKQIIDLAKIFKKAEEITHYRPHMVKGVIGMISDSKTPENLAKGFLRAKYNISVFRDGTARFDATEIPITHFVPSEIGLSLEQLKKLGYKKDIHNKEISNTNQIIELKPQDIILNETAGDFFVGVANFVDELLIYLYKLKPFYNVNSPAGLIGHLVINIAPHTSAGTIGRIIGFSKVRGILAHPFMHCACRRNCDGDELSTILLLDGLLNFSLKFLPSSRGGKMDAPLILTAVLDPREIDDEAHDMETVWKYPLTFYESACSYAPPAELKIETVKARLGTPKQYYDFGFTHSATLNAPVQTQYVNLKTMPEKVKRELDLMKRIRAVDSKDAAERIILSHFFPDLYGNLRKFSKQTFRCVECGAKYRRLPLTGKCSKCGGKLLLTVTRGGIEKYLSISKKMMDEYDLPLYLKQRVLLLEKEINSLFESDKSKQYSLASFV